MNKQIEANIEQIRKRIIGACRRSNRHPDEVKLLLATKTIPAGQIITALNAGCTLIAENKIQEVKAKADALKVISHTNHFIGHLQTNKIKDLLRYNISCIQSVDRYELAEKLNARLAVTNSFKDIFIQVNTSREDSKFGVHPEDTLSLVRRISKFNHVRIRGLMTIGLLSNESDKVRNCFKTLNQLKQHIASLQLAGVDMQELSMGMSGDFEIAVEEGATIVRVGTAVFGRRITPDSYYWNESNAKIKT